MFTSTRSFTNSDIFIVNARIQDDYVYTVIVNPLVLLNRNITFESGHFNFSDPVAAGNFLWTMNIGYYVQFQQRIGITLLGPPRWGGYYPVDRVRDSNVPLSAKDFGNFFVFTVIDNTIERQNIFIALCTILAGVTFEEIRNVASLSDFSQPVPVL
jgi:hypothetical protein